MLVRTVAICVVTLTMSQAVRADSIDWVSGYPKLVNLYGTPNVIDCRASGSVSAGNAVYFLIWKDGWAEWLTCETQKDGSVYRANLNPGTGYYFIYPAVWHPPGPGTLGYWVVTGPQVTITVP